MTSGFVLMFRQAQHIASSTNLWVGRFLGLRRLELAEGSKDVERSAKLSCIPFLKFPPLLRGRAREGGWRDYLHPPPDYEGSYTAAFHPPPGDIFVASGITRSPHQRICSSSSAISPDGQSKNSTIKA